MIVKMDSIPAAFLHDVLFDLGYTTQGQLQNLDSSWGSIASHYLIERQEYVLFLKTNKPVLECTFAHVGTKGRVSFTPKQFLAKDKRFHIVTHFHIEVDPYRNLLEDDRDEEEQVEEFPNSYAFGKLSLQELPKLFLTSASRCPALYEFLALHCAVLDTDLQFIPNPEALEVAYSVLKNVTSFKKLKLHFSGNESTLFLKNQVEQNNTVERFLITGAWPQNIATDLEMAAVKPLIGSFVVTRKVEVAIRFSAFDQIVRNWMEETHLEEWLVEEPHQNLWQRCVFGRRKLEDPVESRLQSRGRTSSSVFILFAKIAESPERFPSYYKVSVSGDKTELRVVHPTLERYYLYASIENGEVLLLNFIWCRCPNRRVRLGCSAQKFGFV
ncbi:hypothetical protein L596_006561 [Steinernema carpocapsae]|uniref:Uncharacterized protein n=1 Tax=Steinernema carpocapsae TaxID=34508 RepID=A0A4U8V2P3_STECR|nr:hypothetical protein L596_006561 [Steinernema carpocapsae]